MYLRDDELQMPLLNSTQGIIDNLGSTVNICLWSRFPWIVAQISLSVLSLLTYEKSRIRETTRKTSSNAANEFMFLLNNKCNDSNMG
jgi:hypothetical protein